ncbi:hypothetical protein CALCODRAFT_501660 [Calocera cornea HHB12733]|uniref:DNA polymerase delta subunit 3 n=1 Tax=Calocera cornea HHB12733 TaxID=1353952 RepID=A0A165DJ37_9BASI|nr:hypothetical protein CALCODRAFT_501660 [Calocera cornea HHB12733]
MSTSDLLTKLVLHEKQIVTYRTLSRQQSIHVNQAKNELAAFYQATKAADPSSIQATFVVTGLARPEPKPANGLADDDMDLDMPSSSQPQEPETGDWGTTKVVLCTEEVLEGTKAEFARVQSVHIYSLSVAPIKDPSILSTTLESVRKADASATQEQLRAFGIAIGDVSVITTKSSAKGKNKTVAPPAAAAVKPTAAVPEEKKADVPEKKASSRNGTLSFGNAKPKEVKEVAPPLVREQPKKNVKSEEPKPGLEAQKPVPPVQTQRSSSGSGLNRKRGLVLSEDEDESPPVPVPKPTTAKAHTTFGPKSKQQLPAKREEELEEEEEDAPVRPGARKSNGKAQKAKSAKEASLAAMFDESSDVEMQPAPPAKPVAREEVVEIADDEVEEEVEQMDESEAAGIDKPKNKRRPKPKPKEGAVVMKDGKKKKRVVKSKMTTNDRGYMMMEDYSEYETVSESEALTVPDKAKKATAKREEKPKEIVREEGSKPKSKPKSAAANGAKKGGGKLSDYFSKK